MDPWANGDMNQPDLSNPRIKSTVDDGANPNERTIVAIENVGFEPGDPITQAQKRTCADIIAFYHKAAGVPINRNTVIGHYQINSVTRPNCPAHDKDILDEIVAMAQDGTATEDPKVIEELKDKLAACEDTKAKRFRTIVALRAQRDELLAQIAALEDELADALALAQTAEELRIRVRSFRNRIEAIKAKIAALNTDIADD
jgi:hypothetical protein